VLIIIPRPPSSTLFPYTTLFRSLAEQRLADAGDVSVDVGRQSGDVSSDLRACGQDARKVVGQGIEPGFEHGVGKRTPHRQMLDRSEEHTSELQSRENLVCRLLLE